MIFQDHVQWPAIGDPKQEADFNKLKAELNEAIGNRWPVTIKYHPNLIQLIPDSDEPSGYRIEKPAEKRIKLQWTAKGLDGKNHVYTYCDNYDPDPLTKKNVYTPNAIGIDGTRAFSKDDIELVMFLYLAYPTLEGGKNYVSGSIGLVFDLPHVEKQKSNEYKTMYGKVLTLITNRESGMSMDNLRKMLSSYFVSNVDKMEEYEVTDLMEKKATEGDTTAKKMESMKLFLFREGNPEGMRVRWICQRAIEKGFIEYNPTRHVWNMIEDKMPIDPPLCKVTPPLDKFQVLYESMSGAPENREYFKMLETFLGVESKEAKAKAKVVEEVAEPGTEEEIIVSTPPKVNPFQKKK